MLVIFYEQEETVSEPSAKGGKGNSGMKDVSAGEHDPELELMKQRLQAIIEEYETSQEEMKASNEELQSSNEELRSTMEELETSKEELQSMNEELQTLNQENRHKVEELAQLTYDLQNLMAATEIATVFLDRDLRILRFTPKISDIINVRMTDRGRPLSDLTHRLGYDELEEDARRVLEDLAPIQHEVQDDQGRWYLSWILPHRSSADRIEGVVMNFIDINARKEAEEALRRQKRELWELNQSLERLVTERTAELEDRNKELQNFAYIASHDLREPLRKIQAYCWKRQGMHLGKKVANTLNVYSLRLHAWMDY